MASIHNINFPQPGGEKTPGIGGCPVVDHSRLRQTASLPLYQTLRAILLNADPLHGSAGCGQQKHV